VHSAWDDGGGTIAEIAAAALALGYRYLALTSHVDPGNADDGLTLDLLRRQLADLARYNARETGLTFLSAVQVEIGPAGVLACPAGVRELADIVVGALPTAADLAPAEHNARLLAAIQDGQLDVIAHPTSRLLQHRDATTLDWERLLPETVARQIAWEINANWRRLDLGERQARHVANAGALLTISSDAHHPTQLPAMMFGVAVARRAAIPPEQVLNTRDLDQMRAWVAARRAIRLGRASKG